MAIAATMRIIGMNMIPRYPRIRRESLAFALQPPELFLISERNICPRIAATIKNGKTLIMPHTRLAIALPLDCGGPAS